MDAFTFGCHLQLSGMEWELRTKTFPVRPLEIEVWVFRDGTVNFFASVPWVGPPGCFRLVWRLAQGVRIKVDSPFLVEGRGCTALVKWFVLSQNVVNH